MPQTLWTPSPQGKTRRRIKPILSIIVHAMVHEAVIYHGSEFFLSSLRSVRIILPKHSIEQVRVLRIDNGTLSTPI